MKQLVFLLSTLLFMAACKKESNTPFIPYTVNDYVMLKANNYWIYETYQIEPDGKETDKQYTDSIFVEKDTIMNNNTYFKLNTFNKNISNTNYLLRETNYYRDSSGYLVNDKGEIWFSVFNFSDTLLLSNFGGIGYIIYYQMDAPSGPVVSSIPQELCYVGYFSKTDGSELRLAKYTYQKGIGKTLYRYFYVSSPNYFENRLVRYRVE